MREKILNIGLAGNPNSGKSSLFNHLTGLNQKIANFPGVTVEKKSGKLLLPDGHNVNLVDFPGAYSLHATTMDEHVFTKLLEDKENESYPDIICYVINSEHIDRHLLLASQILDLNIPLILILSMSDVALIDSDKKNEIKAYFNVPIVRFSAKTGEGIHDLKAAITGLISKLEQGTLEQDKFLVHTKWDHKLKEENIKYSSDSSFSYYDFINAINTEIKSGQGPTSSVLKSQVWDTMLRYEKLEPLIGRLQTNENFQISEPHKKLDRILIHPLWGMLIFICIMLIIFQSIFSWSEIPIELLETAFSSSASWLQSVLPSIWWSEMLVNGVIPGISGIVVFIPQIMFLFIFISILEETGYMSRVVYLFDYWMRKFGLNGRSTIALISGGACAIPAIMSTRTISNWKERLITIMVTPMISCSARLPVYSLLIVFVIPAGRLFGFLNYRGLAFFGIYLFSTMAALFAAYIFKKILKSSEPSQLMLELPNYKMPIAKNVFLNVWEKVRSFIVEAGKVIFVISIILWALTSYGPQKRLDKAMKTYEKDKTSQQQVPFQTESSVRLENSYAAVMGHWLEPVIRPLGFDWKIGIALISSFAAREVFVGTIAIIYSAHDDGEDTDKLSELLFKQVDPITGKKVFNTATSASLIMFYIFAMQCLSTVAVVRKETKSWKWPIIQLVAYTLLAYFASLLTFNLINFF